MKDTLCKLLQLSGAVPDPEGSRDLLSLDPIGSQVSCLAAPLAPLTLPPFTRNPHHSSTRSISSSSGALPQRSPLYATCANAQRCRSRANCSLVNCLLVGWGRVEGREKGGTGKEEGLFSPSFPPLQHPDTIHHFVAAATLAQRREGVGSL